MLRNSRPQRARFVRPNFNQFLQRQYKSRNRHGHSGQGANAHLDPSPPHFQPQFTREIGQLDRAVNDLRRRAPDLSAATPLPSWQWLLLLITVASLSAGTVIRDSFGVYIWSLMLAIPFLMIAIIRLVAVWHILVPSRRDADHLSLASLRADDAGLPTISVLIPLFREADVVPGLVSSMAALDYPADRVEVLFVTEIDDMVTRAAVLAAHLQPNMRVVTVPKGLPRTKPRALNYALQVARGTLVTIYDAEDHPDRMQLRIAAQAFIAGGPRLACVQGRLTIHNAADGFLCRQFALEYAALFGGLLPALDKLRLPIPLGGTSNHFRRDVLIRAGGWDPFNVTEDADLGVRLARLGYEVSVINSQTEEEAPVRLRVWIGQRTRWLKGWIQTYLVHMRRPVRLWRDLGARQFVGFHVVFGGMILSTLVHPWFYVLLAVHGFEGAFLPSDRLLLSVCTFNLVAGYGAAALLIAATASRSRIPGRLSAVFYLPVYWLLISYAAYRAVLDLIFRPFYWEKTAHGSAGRKTPA